MLSASIVQGFQWGRDGRSGPLSCWWEVDGPDVFLLAERLITRVDEFIGRSWEILFSLKTLMDWNLQFEGWWWKNVLKGKPWMNIEHHSLWHHSLGIRSSLNSYFWQHKYGGPNGLLWWGRFFNSMTIFRLLMFSLHTTFNRLQTFNF